MAAQTPPRIRISTNTHLNTTTTTTTIHHQSRHPHDGHHQHYAPHVSLPYNPASTSPPSHRAAAAAAVAGTSWPTTASSSSSASITTARTTQSQQPAQLLPPDGNTFHPATLGQSFDRDKPAGAAPGWAPAGPQGETHASGGGASRFPSPPSSSPAVATDDANIVSMASQTARHHVSLDQQQHPAAPSSSHSNATVDGAFASLPQQQQQQPSPPFDEFPPSATTQTPTAHSSYAAGTDVPSLLAQDAASNSAPPQQQTVIHIRDLAHVQSLARADMRAGHGPDSLNDPPLQQMKYEISAMPIGDIIEMVAALLTKITTTNDLQHDAMQRNVTHQQQASQNSEAAGSSQMSPLSHSVLAFHGKNVPAITILSYLSRIHKYCPTTYEVFLSLLVYFDRMTERVNELVAKSEETRRQSTSGLPRQGSQQQHDVQMRDDSGACEVEDSDSDLADDDDDEEEDDDEDMEDSPAGSNRNTTSRPPTARSEQQAVTTPATYFVVDSFNIHRLIISGVTCASKFFSDVFYTNSRYAKVGGLPLAELNHLELQFLVLNEFRLFVPVEDLEAYATMLVEFYIREVVGKQLSTDSRE
ncbi:LOW QUALITY PROTEIN: PHO85 cyclin-6 [Paramyrothecium foliicola]|nr:LOW QUALITY PROTEIN: PHO85 cyclin-6 [Paramyrothecium foliicola]